jgi:sugar phosphate isomerase/epimerase
MMGKEPLYLAMLRRFATGHKSLASQVQDALADGDLAFLQFCDALPLGEPGAMDLGDAMVNGRAMAGDGEFPLDEFCNHAVRRDYDGVVSVEILSSAWRARPLDEFVTTSLETTKACFERAKEDLSG